MDYKNKINNFLFKDFKNQRKKKYFFRYVVIGASSIFIELLFRKFLLIFTLSELIYMIVPLLIGIVYAFIMNIIFNFKIPRYYYIKSFIYFSVISISSFITQHYLSKVFIVEKLNYEFTRFFFSGLIFIIAYNFHIKFSFAKQKKVGVALYLNVSENINEIFTKVMFYPDYIHVDFVDNTMNENSENYALKKLIEIKKKWPNHRIESHIMSRKPLKYIKYFSKYSDVIYFHYEIDQEIEKVKNLILRHNVIPGVVLHASKKYNNLENLIKSYKEILILCIEKPGSSGQKFLNQSINLINKINKLKNRDKFNLCVDGGLSQNNISKIQCEKIVSASNIFKNKNPKKQINFLKKILNN